MKKLFYSMFMLAAMLAFTACEDVPNPYDVPSNTSGNETDYSSATGSGTAADPYNVIAALKLTSELGADVNSEVVYIKGKIVSINEEYGTQYGNATYYISDDGTTTNQFYVFRSLYLGNQKYTSGTQIKVGDEVIVCGQIVNYKGNTPETVQNQSYLYSLNGEGGETPSSGEVKTATIAEFNAAEESTSVWYQLTGTVKNLKDGDKYGNFDLEDETGSVYVYGLLSEKDGAKQQFQALVAEKGIQEGSKITIIGNRGSYNGKIEVLNAYFVSIEGGSVTPTPSSDNLLTNGDFETWADGLPTNWKSTSTASNAKLSQSSDAHGGSYSVQVASASSNQRLAYQEIALKAGTYTFKFYAKATTGGKSQTRAGYVPVTDGKVGNYQYSTEYPNLNNTSWTEVTYSFTLSEATTVCLVVMNPKGSNYVDAQDILIDDATLTTSDGGLDNGSGTGGTTTDDVKTVTIAEFNAAAESTDVWYKLTGTVKNLKDGDQYGNFDLEDNTGSVYVYGVLSEKGGAKKLFQTLAAEKGIKEGSTLTIIGNRGSYNSKIEVINAYFVSVSN